MRRPLWQRLGLDDDEWLDCCRAAVETSLATGARVSPRQVAVEYALARDFDMPVHAEALVAPPAAARSPHALPGAALHRT